MFTPNDAMRQPPKPTAEEQMCMKQKQDTIIG